MSENVSYIELIKRVVSETFNTVIVDPHSSFQALGIDSVGLISILDQLETDYSLEIPIEFIAFYRSPHLLSEALEILKCGGLVEWIKQGKPVDSSMLAKFSEYVRNTPYNSAFAFVKKFAPSQIPNGNWGHNCIGLSQESRDLFVQGSSRSAFLVSRRRRPLLLKSDDSVCMLDPYTLHCAPIPLDAIVASQGLVQRHKVYPNSPEFFEELSYIGDKRILQRKVTDRGVMECNFDLDRFSIADVDALDSGLLFDPEQDNLSIRVYSEEENCTVHIVAPLAPAYLKFWESGSTKVRFFAIVGAQLISESSSEFKDALNIIASHVGVNHAEVISFLNLAVSCYLSNCRPGITFGNVGKNPSNL